MGPCSLRTFKEDRQRIQLTDLSKEEKSNYSIHYPCIASEDEAKRRVAPVHLAYHRV